MTVALCELLNIVKIAVLPLRRGEMDSSEIAVLPMRRGQTATRASMS